MSQLYSKGSAPSSGAIRLSKTPFSLLFDKLSTGNQNACQGAFSLRRVRLNYTGPIVRIRNGTSNSQSDFYYIGDGNLNTLANGSGQNVSTWLSGATGYVSIWYNQAGVAGNLSNSASGQPAINSSGNLISLNGTQWLTTSTCPLAIGQKQYTYYADISTPASLANGTYTTILEQVPSSITVNNCSRLLLVGQSGNPILYFGGEGNDAFMGSVSLNARVKTSLSVNDNVVNPANNLSLKVNGGASNAYKTGTSGTLTVGANSFDVGRKANGFEYFTGSIREVLVFNTNLGDADAQTLYTYGMS